MTLNSSVNTRHPSIVHYGHIQLSNEIFIPQHRFTKSLKMISFHVHFFFLFISICASVLRSIYCKQVRIICAANCILCDEVDTCHIHGCAPGYYFINEKCTQNSPCNLQPWHCGNNGACVITDEWPYYKCLCAKGYSGQRCYEACAPNCDYCTYSNTCSKDGCSVRYTYNRYTKTCAACVPNCLSCLMPNTCKTDGCDSGFIYNVTNKQCAIITEELSISSNVIRIAIGCAAAVFLIVASVITGIVVVKRILKSRSKHKDNYLQLSPVQSKTVYTGLQKSRTSQLGTESIYDIIDDATVGSVTSCRPSAIIELSSAVNTSSKCDKELYCGLNFQNETMQHYATIHTDNVNLNCDQLGRNALYIELLSSTRSTPLCYEELNDDINSEVNSNEELNEDTINEVKSNEELNEDTSNEVSSNEELNDDTNSEVNSNEKLNKDTINEVKSNEELNEDTSSEMNSNDPVHDEELSKDCSCELRGYEPEYTMK